MSEPTLATWLKRETRVEHHRVDQHPALKPLLRRELAIEEYATALSALYAPVASLEAALSSGLDAHGVNYPLKQREALLKADILQLGRQVPPASRLPPLATIEAIVGTLYVLEGSRLGGAMIARHVRHVLGSDVLGNQVPLRFFAAAPLQGQEWAAFWVFAENLCPPPSWPAVRASAQQAFAHFILGLEAFVNSNPTPKE